MKFLLSILLWIFGAEVPVDIQNGISISPIEIQQLEQNDQPTVVQRTGPKDRRFGGHIIIFEDTHFRRKN